MVKNFLLWKWYVILLEFVGVLYMVEFAQSGNLLNRFLQHSKGHTSRSDTDTSKLFKTGFCFW